jgi:hypothetical protein
MELSGFLCSRPGNFQSSLFTRKSCGPYRWSLHVHSSLFTQSVTKYTSFHYDAKQVIEEA